MKQLELAIRSMIDISDAEIDLFLNQCFVKTFRKNEVIGRAQLVPNEIFFIKKGLIRVIINDQNGEDQTIHFALENQFIADYSNFLLQTPAMYSLQALEETETIVLPRSAVNWGYKNLQEGNKLGRLIAEFYFIYQDQRIKNIYSRTAKERYDTITDIFPNIHTRAPQHMIASYLGITPIHLSRLKKGDYKKV